MKTVNKQYYEVLVDYVFGSVNPQISDIASGGAYSDMARHTLVTTKDMSNLSLEEKKAFDKKKEDAKKEWKEDIVENIICPQIESLINNGTTDFDKWHETVCNEIILESDKMLAEISIVLHYGQAQKWLNMTLKNMLILENWKITDSIKNSMHCPVDGYIITAAKKLGVKIPKKEDKPWSIWNKADYVDFQKNLVSKLKGSRIEWEIESWPIYKKKLKKS